MLTTYTNPERNEWPELLARPSLDLKQLQSSVSEILERVKNEGDKALFELTLRFDGARIPELKVKSEEFELAENQVSEELKNAIQTAAANIRTFHKSQLSEIEVIETMPGVNCWRKSVGIEKVGLYIPGGTAPLFSTVLMLGIPAVLAGCKEIVLCSPPDSSGNINPAILYAAKLVGIKTVFKVGGSQAIGALAYGTESIPKCYKIFGPGNQYVTCAKTLVSMDGIAIDMPAGPSEVAVIIDETSNPAFVAADLLSQAEHGADSQVVLFCTDESLLPLVNVELEKQLNALPRKQFAQQALQNSRAFVQSNEAVLIDMVNEYAAEHLIIATSNPEAIANQVINAGSVFLGHFTPESAGDYASGTNHTLPTSAFAKMYSGVSVDSFVKKITFQKINEQGLINLGPTIEIMAEAEELLAHKNAVTIRLNALAS